VALAKRSEERRSIERRANIAALNDYINLVVTKGLGVAALVVGGIAFLDPGALHITLKNPGLVAGAGLAMLTGRNIISIVAKLEGLIK